MISSSFMAFRTDCVIMTPVFVPPAWTPVLNLRLQVRVPGISARVSNRRLTLNTLTTELQLFLSNVLLPESFSSQWIRVLFFTSLRLKLYQLYFVYANAHVRLFVYMVCAYACLCACVYVFAHCVYSICKLVCVKTQHLYRTNAQQWIISMCQEIEMLTATLETLHVPRASPLRINLPGFSVRLYFVFSTTSFIISSAVSALRHHCATRVAVPASSLASLLFCTFFLSLSTGSQRWVLWRVSPILSLSPLLKKQRSLPVSLGARVPANIDGISSCSWFFLLTKNRWLCKKEQKTETRPYFLFVGHISEAAARKKSGRV